MAKKKPNYTLRQTGLGAGLGAAAGAGASVFKDTDTSYVPQVTEKLAQDPNSDVPRSIMTHVYNMVPPEATPFHDIVHHAADSGVKGALIGGAAVLGYKGYKAIKNRNLGRQFD